MTSDSASLEDQAQRLRDVIGVGVTGHRLDWLGTENVPAVASAIDRALAAIESAAVGPHDAELRMITSLADGVDMIASDVALTRGWPVDTILPFARAEYANDFDEASGLVDHERLLAASRSVFELPGERSADGEWTAYERAGRVTLAQCDLLLAVWDGKPPRGRGGTGQIVAEAVLQGIPVILIDAVAAHPPQLLWDGLIEHDLGQQSIETVARGDLSALPRLLAALVARPDVPSDLRMLDAFSRPVRQRMAFAVVYPLLQALVGVRGLRRSDFSVPDLAKARATVAASTAAAQRRGDRFRQRLDALAGRFARADAEAVIAARVFRSSYIANFMLAALAVVLSLCGLLIAPQFKLVLVVLEFLTIASILLITRAGSRLDLHRRWLDHRELAERLRCLALSAQLGDLNLRENQGGSQSWFDWFARAIARETGLPSLVVDRTYVEEVRDGLRGLLDDQIAYLTSNSRTMHLLEHRLHRIGVVLFASTAAICVGILLFVGMSRFGSDVFDSLAQTVIKASIVFSAALPAIGSAIYGIRMQGDFGGSSARDAALAQQLTTLRHVVDQDEPSFDTLKLRVARATGLLTADLADWGQAFRARPLTLPG